MRKSSLKALYIFLTTWLGIILLVMLHRALFVIYDLLALFFPEVLLFGADRSLLQALDFFTLLVATFFGGWYGVWLGLHWFEIVYEKGGVHHNQIFHGFLPHAFRTKHQVKKNTTAIKNEPAPIEKKSVAIKSDQDQSTKNSDEGPKKPERTQTFKSLVKHARDFDIKTTRGWGIDDLIATTINSVSSDSDSSDQEKEKVEPEEIEKKSAKVVKKTTTRKAKKKTTKKKSAAKKTVAKKSTSPKKRKTKASKATAK